MHPKLIVEEYAEGDIVHVKKNQCCVYSTPYTAWQKEHPIFILPEGDYYIYKIINGMLNLTKKKDAPGCWINPNSLKY